MKPWPHALTLSKDEFSSRSFFFKTILSLRLTFTVVFFYGINWTRVEEEEGEERRKVLSLK